MKIVSIPGRDPIPRLSDNASSVLRRLKVNPLMLSSIAPVVRNRLMTLGLVTFAARPAVDDRGARMMFSQVVLTSLGREYLDHVEMRPLSDKALAMLERIEREGEVRLVEISISMLNRLLQDGVVVFVGPDRRCVALSARGRAWLARRRAGG